jgi:chemotaxis protein methyltransferase CheR
MSDPRTIDSTPPISDEELYLLNETIGERFGLHFPEHKREILAARLRPRLEALHLRSFFDYYLELRHGNGRETGLLAQLLTNNETYFFREAQQIEDLFRHGVPLLLGERRWTSPLRLLSAGCSSGEEPYSLAIEAAERRLQGQLAGIDIEACDIDQARLTMAQSAQYTVYSLRSVSEERIRRYFTTLPDSRYELKGTYRDTVSFSPGNIVSLESLSRPYLYDVVFCRNVLIYFSDAGVERAITAFARILRPGGLLFLGHSESIIGRFREFETLRLGSCLVYRRTSR